MQCDIERRCTTEPHKTTSATSINNCLKKCYEDVEFKCKWVSFTERFQTCVLFSKATCEDDGTVPIDGTKSSQLECYIECPIKQGRCNAVSLINFLLI